MAGSSDNVLDTLFTLIRQRMDGHANYMLDGKCKDWADYKFQSGILQGLGEAQQELEDLVKRIQEA